VVDQKNDVRWLAVNIKTNGEIAEALAEVLGRFVDNGVVIETETTFNPRTQEYEPSGGLQVSGYLSVDDGLEEKRHKLEEALWHLRQISPFPEAQYTPVRDENWMAAWKEHYSPIPIGDSLLIMPAWKTPKVGETRHIVRINPAMAFGTGTHPSTQLCLQLMERHLVTGERMIDIGCGSGILSIAAIKMGASYALGADLSEQALISTLENAQLNDIEMNKLEVGKGSVEEILTGRFQIKNAALVLVNILAAIIIRLLGQGLADLVDQNGTLILSGILDHQEPMIVEATEKAGFKQLERLSDADWVALALIKL